MMNDRSVATPVLTAVQANNKRMFKTSRNILHLFCRDNTQCLSRDGDLRNKSCQLIKFVIRQLKSSIILQLKHNYVLCFD